MKELGIAAVVAACVGVIVLLAYVTIEPQLPVVERVESVPLTPATPSANASPAPGTGTPATDATGAAGSSGAELGQTVANSRGCLGCHSTDGSERIGPSWQGLAGRLVTFTDGSSTTADDAYLREAILDPGSRIVEGFTDDMPASISAGLSDEEVEGLIAYIKTLQ